MPEKATPIECLRAVMARLRDPDGGCPWDVAQTHESISPHTIEEAYEVADAVRSGDAHALRDELGDLLLQVIFQARIAEEAGDFDFDDVARSITEKMRRRHPHVFGDTIYKDSDEQRAAWEAIKAEEKKERGGEDESGESILDGITAGLPANIRAVKLQKRAAAVGFDWAHAADVIAKIREETDEVADEIESGDKARITEELGDLLFAVINLARKTGCDAEDALARANEKFTRRFAAVEDAAAKRGKPLDECSLDEMEQWWRENK